MPLVATRKTQLSAAPVWATVFVTLLCMGSLPASLFADITLPKIFSDHMVLQQKSEVKIWGTAEPNDKLIVKFDQQVINVQAKADGSWSGQISTPAAGGPYEIEVAVEEGEPKVLISDVMIGEVWICGGDENLLFPVSQSLNPETEIEQSKNFSKIRLFKVEESAVSQPQTEFTKVQPWECCSPETIKDFSAASYFFARELSKKVDVPIGLIQVTAAGSLAESWVSEKGMASSEKLEPLVEYWKDNPDPANRMAPSVFYNGMLAPSTGYLFRGAIWFQGNANVGRGKQYFQLLLTLIGDWRTRLGGGKPFPFYYVQVPPVRIELQSPEALPELWDSQAKVLREIENVGMVVATDVPPKNKQEIGRRLALWALAETYKDSLKEDEKVGEYSGPIYESMAILDGKIRLTFKHSGSGLKAKDAKPLSGFTICGDDKKFVAAEAVIEGEVVIVSCPEIKNPVAVRFAWSDSAKSNFTGFNELPASPFRTDDFELLSAGRSH